MGVRQLREAFRLIEENHGDFSGPKESSLVDRAEKVLGMKFPPTYRQFLETYGCGDIGGFEVYGIIGNDFDSSGIPDAIWLTMQLRKTGLPEHYIVISDEGDGAICVLDSNAANDDGEFPVLRYELDGTVSLLGEDFGTFLVSEIESVL